MGTVVNSIQDWGAKSLINKVSTTNKQG